MKSKPAFALVLATLWFVFAPFAQAQVQASLVAAESSVQPGGSVDVALKLEHQPQWHTYWINAGTGYPTELKWELPTGWRAGEIRWPTPRLIRDAKGEVTGHGYEGLLYLPLTVTAPADLRPGQDVLLKAQASWLMCADVCIPGSADVSLTLPVAEGPPKVDPVVQAGIAGMPMPHDARGWSVEASHDGASVILRVSGPDEIHDPHFYSENEDIQYDQPQKVAGGLHQATLALPLAEGVKLPDMLIGLLGYTDASGTYRGLKVDAPLSSSLSASAQPQAGVSSATDEGARPTQLSVGVLVLAFLGGLILNLMPCVFPVLGIKIMGFVSEAGRDRQHVTIHGLLFTLGVVLSFWGLAALLTIFRAGGDRLGWGFQLQSAPFVFALAAVMLIFALNLSGVFEFGLRATGVAAQLQARRGYPGSFFAGVLATIVATPCSAPFLAPALGAALTLPSAQSFAVFTVIALGLSAPYLLLSAFPQAISALPRPGRWMETFKQVMAFPLYATVAYLIWVLAAQTSESGLLSALFGLTAVAMALWLYGRFNTPGVSAVPARFAIAGGLALLILGLSLGWPRAAQPSDLVWEPWSVERVGQLRAENRLIYVDFTARWCATCQTNKKIVFSSEEVRRYFREHQVALLKADWTNNDPRITAELSKWKRSAIPFNLVYRPDVAEPQVLPEILTPSIVLGKFRGN